MKKKAVITGISGYIGSNLAKELVLQGWEVHGIIRPSSDLHLLQEVEDKLYFCIYDGQIETLIDYFKTIGAVDIVIHLASLFLSDHKWQQVDALIESNLRLGMHLLEGMKQAGYKNFINTSTAWQHYNDQEYNPVCLYAATKEAFEKIITYYVKVQKFSCITLEIFDTYGPDDPRNKVLNLIKRCYIEKKNLGMSPGEQLLDLVYIDDVIQAYIQTIELTHKPFGVHEKYMLTNGKRYTLKEVVSCFEEIIDEKLPIAFGERPYREREIMNPWNKGKKHPLWIPKYNLKQGITHLIKEEKLIKRHNTI